ncbi:apolipoprotein D-like [Tachypleus tridentatus]|uniref:apolipoprotein D-like n=1 Tax=Tachypleus tridentatus TaxID=6853 RepID=UPI003FD5C71E
MKSQVIVVALICGLCKSQYLAPGSCSRPEVVKNLNLNKFLGKWYEIQKTYTFFERNLRCVNAEYNNLGKGKILVKRTGTDKSGVSKSIGGQAIVPKLSEPAKMIIKFQVAPLIPVNYWILDTDYNRYAVVWSCFNIGPFGLLHSEKLWILSREKYLTAGLLDAIYKNLQRKGIVLNSLRTINQQDCGISKENDIVPNV